MARAKRPNHPVLFELSRRYSIVGLKRHFRCVDYRTFYKKFDSPAVHFTISDIVTAAGLLGREPYEIFALMIDIDTVAMARVNVKGWKSRLPLNFVMTEEEKIALLSEPKIGFNPDIEPRIKI
jgi:hypothetical protein